MASRKWLPLLFPRSWQLVVVEVPAEEVEYVRLRNQRIWRQLARLDPEMARQVEPFLTLYFSNGNGSPASHNRL
ncbi:MAG: hypothetical protein NZ520_04745 [bacterium]|nr:hypothetical protein [bacterium]